MEYKISFDMDDLKLFITNNYRAKNKKYSNSYKTIFSLA